MSRHFFYSVVILTETGWQVSRTCETKRVATNYAKGCSKTWDAMVYKGGPGGERVAEFSKVVKVA